MAVDPRNQPQDAASDRAARIQYLVDNFGATPSQAATIAESEPAGTPVTAPVPTAFTTTPAAAGGSKLGSDKAAPGTKSTGDPFDFTNKKAPQKYVTQFKRLPKAPDPSFIKGGKTKAERSAFARALANKTITSGMSASDAAAIRKARIWYTGQTAGRTGKGKAGDAKYGANSVKAKRLALSKKKPKAEVKDPKKYKGGDPRQSGTSPNAAGKPKVTKPKVVEPKVPKSKLNLAGSLEHGGAQPVSAERAKNEAVKMLVGPSPAHTPFRGSAPLSSTPKATSASRLPRTPKVKDLARNKGSKKYNKPGR